VSAQLILVTQWCAFLLSSKLLLLPPRNYLILFSFYIPIMAKSTSNYGKKHVKLWQKARQKLWQYVDSCHNSDYSIKNSPEKRRQR
jgi:hypothetical protein